MLKKHTTTSPSIYLTEEEAYSCHRTTQNSLHKIRYLIDEDFNKLDTLTRNENNVANRMLSSVFDTFYEALDKNLATLHRKFSVNISLNGTKLILQSESKNFDSLFARQFDCQHNLIHNSMFNFFLNIIGS